MRSELTNLLTDQPHTYYCVASSAKEAGMVKLPDMVTEGKRLYTTPAVRVYSSEELADAACVKKTDRALELVCLACFLNILRPRIGTDAMVLDDVLHCSVAAWRAPCQTTAVLEDDGERYYVEGCAEGGVFWSHASEKAETTPPFLQCGAQYADCVWGGCPRDYPYLNAEPITLCTTTRPADAPPDVECHVRFDAPHGSFYFAGMSPQGFDMAPSPASAANLRADQAERVATALANVHIHWSDGMMAGAPGCSVTVVTTAGREVMVIR